MLPVLTEEVWIQPSHQTATAFRSHKKSVHCQQIEGSVLSTSWGFQVDIGKILTKETGAHLIQDRAEARADHLLWGFQSM